MTRFDPKLTPELVGTHYVEALRVMSEAAASSGLLVLLACHRMNVDEWPGDGFWYSRAVPEASVRRSWEKVASMLCSQVWRSISHSIRKRVRAYWCVDIRYIVLACQRLP